MNTIVGLAFIALLVAAYFYIEGVRSVEDLKRWAADRRAARRDAEAAASRERASGIEVALTPAEVLEAATESMTRAGYGIESRTASTATFARSAQMNPALGCLLAFLFLLPALIYMLAVAGKTNRVTVAAYPQGPGSRVVIGGDSRKEVARLRQWVKALPSQPTTCT